MAETYLGDVFLDPQQELSLIQQPNVEVAVVLDPLARKEPPHANAVVEVHQYDIMPRPLDDLGAVPVGICERDIAYDTRPGSASSQTDEKTAERTPEGKLGPTTYLLPG